MQLLNNPYKLVFGLIFHLAKKGKDDNDKQSQSIYSIESTFEIFQLEISGK